MTEYLDLKFFLDPTRHGYYGTFILGDGDAVLDDWIGTAIMISLGTNFRVDDSDRPDNGWWGETLLGNFGSKLYLLDHEKANNRALRLAEQYAADSVQWLIDDGLIFELTRVSASYVNGNQLRILISYKTRDNEVRNHQHIFSQSNGA